MGQYKEYGWSNNEAISQKYLYPRLVELLPNDSKCILDIGCGNGKIANKLIENQYNVHGIDASKEGVLIAKRDSREEGRFFVCNVESNELPYELQHIAFDTIISTEVVEHLYAPREYIAFCKKILEKKGGILIISTPYHGYLKNLALAITGRMEHHFHALWDGGHIKFWSRKSLSELMTEQGFQIVDFKGCGRVPFLWKSMCIKAKLDV